MSKLSPLKIMTKLLPDNKFIPSGGLINILAPKTLPNIKYWLHSHLDGKQINDEDRPKFYEQVLNEISNRKYTTTDHLFIRCQISGYNVVFISLDSSLRSERAGHTLSTRLNKICKNINVLMREIGGDCVLFLSEACKPSSNWNAAGQKTDSLDWTAMKTIIENECNLTHLLDAPNIDDPNKESYGIAAFTSEGYRNKIKLCKKIVLSNDGLGTAACVVRLWQSDIPSLPNNTVLIGVHLPLDLLEDKASRMVKPIADLQRPKSKNLGYKTAYQLCEYIGECANEYDTSSVCAIGDFNTIYDSPNREISTWIHNAIDNSKYQFVVERDKLTYFGSYFDVHQNVDQELTSIEHLKNVRGLA